MEGVLQTIRALEAARRASARPFAGSGTRGNPARRLAMYSMGNFISGMTWMLAPARLDGILAETGESYLLQVRVARLQDLADGTVAVSAAWRSYDAGRLERMKEYLGVP